LLKIRELLVDLYECESNLDDENFLCATLQAAARKVGATVIQKITTRFSPTGVSAILILAETHISIHTWPEYRYAAVDIFICGEERAPEPAWEVIREAVRPKTFKISRIVRTIRGNLGNGPEKG